MLGAAASRQAAALHTVITRPIRGQSQRISNPHASFSGKPGPWAQYPPKGAETPSPAARRAPAVLHAPYWCIPPGLSGASVHPVRV
ncbi:hypothetical protein G6F57_023820 [Rhizopus arrhizus]|nr:hypothetical protein G6F57_023820 [Rhizopus arrhizus]